VLPFLNSHAAASAAPENLRASGRLTLEQFALAPLVANRLAGDLKIDGRRIEFTGASGQFYGGQISGSLDANLAPAPAYHVDVNFSRVNMAALIDATPALAGLRADSGSGQISIDAHGANRADIVASLTCKGDANVAGAELLNLDLWHALGALGDNGVTRFSDGAATFSCAGRKIQFQKLSLLSATDGELEGSGSVDFSRDLNLRFQASGAEREKPVPAFRLTGPLAAPSVTLASAAPRRGR